MSCTRVRLRRLALLVGLALLPCATGWAQEREDEVVLEGSFFDPAAEEEIRVRRWRHGLELRRGDRVVWREEFGVYLADLLATCRDLESGLDRVVFATSSGGSDGAMSLHLLGAAGGDLARLFVDGTAAPELRRYFHLPEEPADAVRFQPMTGMICAADDYLERRWTGKRVFGALAPGDRSLRLMRRTGGRIARQTLPSRQLSPPLVRSLLRLQETLGPGFAHRTMAETELWRFELVYHHHFGDSWGVLLLEDKSDGSWRSIYELPEGDSKSYLIEPAVVEMGASAARIDFCTVCPADEHAFLDLRTLEVRPLLD